MQARLFFLLLPVSFAWAFWQAPELNLAVRKTMGFNNGSQIQGSFRMEATGPADLASVAFFVDGAEIGTVTAAPFRINFRTEEYALGWHTLSATGQTSGGIALTSTEKRFRFLSSEEAWKSTQGIMIPMFVAIGLAMLIGIGIQFISVGQRPSSLPLGAPRHYGVMGGAVCPRCRRPYARHWWAPNLAFQKLDRCDHCGKWSLVGRASPTELAAAEAAELEQAAALRPAPPPGDRLKQQLDDARFLDEG